MGSCSRCRIDCVNRALSKLFRLIAELISRFPWPFVFVPIIVAGLLCLGFLRFNEETDPEYLYTPTNGPAKDERKIIRSLFPEDNCQSFLSSRKTGLDGYVNVIVQRTDGGNMLTDEYVALLFELDADIRSKVVVTHGDDTYNYSAVCGKWSGQCEQIAILEILANNSVGSINISYPVHQRRYYLGRQLGGVELNPGTDVVKSSKVVMLSYYTGCTSKYGNGSDTDIEIEWQDAAKNYLLKRTGNAKLTVTFLTSQSLEEGIDDSAKSIMIPFTITYTIVFTFTVSTMMLKDWVRSKFWFGWGGIMTIALAIVSSLGFGLAVGLPLTATVGSMPFLIVGIGVDDLFVMLASWRTTSYMVPTKQRMADTYESAAVSVTITSLTNILAFAVGAITTFPSVQLFCAFTGIGVFFAYAYVITLQGAFLYFTGNAEEKNFHSVACKKVLPAEEAEDRSGCYRALCVGGHTNTPEEVEAAKVNKELGITEPLLTKLLKNYYGPFIMKWQVKLVAFLLLLGYLAGAIYGCIVLPQGLLLSNLSPDDSYSAKYYDAEYKYFNNEYGARVMFAFTEQLDYHDPTTQQRTFDIVNTVRNKSHFEDAEDLTEYWLIDYNRYLALTGRSDVNKTAFTRILVDEFLKLPGWGEHYRVDVIFNGNGEIAASRFLVQSGETSTTNDEKEMMQEARDSAESAAVKTTAYHPAFIFYDQYLVILTNTLQNMGIALGCMVVVSLVLVPSPLVVVWVTASIASICTGVIGYMSLWNVSLDSVSMINVVMCIGFSVDYSVHISYHYVMSDRPTRNGKAIEAIGTLGMPVIQGAISTILGVCVLSTSSSYIFRTFFKVMFLVICFGFLHAMLFLPVLLTILGPTRNRCSSDNSSMSDESRTDSDSKVHPEEYVNGSAQSVSTGSSDIPMKSASDFGQKPTI